MLSKSNVQITEGAIIPNIIRFVLPVIISNILQISFNAADIAIVGQFCGGDAVAAIGTTTSFVHLLLNVFIGLATGTTIAVSQSLGRGDHPAAKNFSHTAIAIAVCSGAVAAALGVLSARPVLTAMSTPKGAVLDGAVTYLRIYFTGAPVLLLYNFGSAILKANGDTKRPFLYLSLGGIVNILLNIFFVTVLGMSVDGVAIATVVSNIIAATLVFCRLTKIDGPCRVIIKEIKIHKKSLLILLKYGVPIGIQSSMFSLPNLIIQSSVNTFGKAAVAGRSAAQTVYNYLDTTIASFNETTLTFVAGNFGAGLYKRMKKIFWGLLFATTSISFALGVSIYTFSRPILSIFVPENEEAIKYGTIVLRYMALPIFTVAIMFLLSAFLRGIGKPFYPMAVTVLGVCIIRIVWMLFIYPKHPTFECIFFAYPLTWVITSLLLFVYFCICRRRFSADRRADL